MLQVILLLLSYQQEASLQQSHLGTEGERLLSKQNADVAVTRAGVANHAGCCVACFVQLDDTFFYRVLWQGS